jgi:putative cell wall-binding protein
MGNQNSSVARKRLSTLAITTTLAAVGVGVVGTGAANAATTSGTPLAHSQDGQTSTKTSVALKVTTDAAGLSATADLAGTTIGSGVTDPAKVTVAVDFGDGHVDKSIKVDAHGALSASSVAHTYATAKDYTVTVTVTDGVTTPAPSAKAAANFVADPVLKAALTPASNTTKKNTAVTLSLAGSSVDKTAMTPVTTVTWGDGSKVATIPGDPTKIAAGNPLLAHSFAADGKYNVMVKLDDGLGNPNSVQTQTIAVTVSEGAVVLQAAGDTRYETGIQISQHQWADTGVATDHRTQAKAVVLATGDAFPDALAGGPLAKKAGGPLLLTDGLATSVNSKVLAEIQRVLPTKGTTVYILGGTQAMNAGIEAQLRKLGYTTTRLAGEDRFATALQIAQKGMDNPAHLVVARGDEGQNHDGFADALSAGPYAANVFDGGDAAVVLSNFKTFDPATQAYVTSKLHPGTPNVAAIGGQAAAAMTTIKGSAKSYVGFVGSDRYETAAKVAAEFLATGKADQIGIATGTVYADALTGGSYMATVDGPLLLTNPKVLPAFTADAISKSSTQEINIFGGNMAISKDVAKQIAALLKVSAIGKF